MGKTSRAVIRGSRLFNTVFGLLRTGDKISRSLGTSQSGSPPVRITNHQSRSIGVLPRVQRPKLVRLHIKEAAEHPAEIIWVAVAAGGGNLLYVQRTEQQQVFGVMHPCLVDAGRKAMAECFPIDAAEIIRIAMKRPGDFGGGDRFAKPFTNRDLRRSG